MPTFDYISLTNLKAFIGNITDNADDTALNQAIDAACEQINGYCMRRFDSGGATHYYTAEYPDVLFVQDIRAITTLAVDEDGDGTYEVEWASTDYQFAPYNAEAEGEPYTWLELTANGNYAFPVGLRKGIKIIGTWGWSAVPLAIQQATTILAARLFRRNKAAFGVVGSAEMGQVMVIPKLDPDVMQLIDPYRKKVR